MAGRVTFSKWGLTVWAAAVIVGILIFAFTGPLFVFLVAVLLLIVPAAIIIYYLGVNVDRKLRGSSPKTVVEAPTEPSGGDDDGS